MLSETDQYFLQQEEPQKSYLMALRKMILANENMKEAWSYGMPFYYYKDKRVCYLWTHKKYGKPYLGIVDGKKIDHPDLVMENRSRMKILLFDPDKDIPVKTITRILTAALALHK